MSYQKQHFVPEQYLSAAELNHLEDGIELNRTLARNFEAAHIEALFKNSEVEPDRIVDNDTSGWSDTQSAPSANEHTYLTLRIASNKAWSKPIKISSVSRSGGSASGGGSSSSGSGSGSGAGGDSSGSDIDAELRKQLEEIYERLEEAEKTAQDASDLANSLSDQANEKKEQLEQLAQEMTPLAEWTDGTNTGTAGFVAKADQNSAQLAGIATWQGTTSDSIAALELKATETEASITSLTSWQDEKAETIASIQQTASDQAATISMLTEWKGTVENGEAGDTATAIAAINVKVDGLESEIDLLNTYVTEDAEALANFKTTAGNTYATIEGLTKVETDAVNSLATFRNEVTDTYATHEELTSFETDTTKAINRIEQKADANESSIKSLTSWQGTADKSITSIAGIEQKANANEAAIKAAASLQTEHTSAIASLDTRVTETESSITELTEFKTSASSTLTEIQQEASAEYAKIQSLTEWRAAVDSGEAGDKDQAIASLTQQVNEFSGLIAANTERITANSESLTEFKNEASTTYAKVTELANYVSTDALGNKVSEAGFIKEAELTKDYAKKTEVTQLKTELTESISTQIDTATKDFVKSTDIASFVTKDELGKEISKSTAAIEQTVAADYATISSVTAVDNKVTGIQQTVNGNTANIKLVVDNGTVKGNVLVEAINNQSTVSISGDKINLNGNAAFTSAAATASNAATKANNAIKNVQYFYLSTGSPTTAPSVNDSGWKDTADEWQSGKYLWQKIVVTKGDDTVTNSISCLSGATGAALQIRYINSATTPVISNNNVDSWSTAIPAPEANKATYMTQKLSSETNWSIPVQITGQNGKDGVTPTININANGYWVVNGETTTQKATGEDGETPEITIQDGKWCIDGVSTNINATGEAGKDGESIEFVYYRSNSASTPTAPTSTVTVAPPKNNTWTTSPSGITEDFKYEYMSMRVKPSGINQSWGAYSTPVIWSKWGEKGQDGDGVEYKYQAAALPFPPFDLTGEWTDEPQGVSEAKPFEYVKAIRHKGDGTTEESSPKLWATYSKNGKDGTAAPKVKEVKTQYAFTSSDKTAPGASATWGYDDIPTNWTSSDPVCVWTRDEFTFDDSTVIYTDPVFNQSYSNIANWCDATDRTLINGANIATGSITAQQIAAGSITANEIDATNLKVNAANITGTLTASQINGEGLKLSSSDSASKITLENGKLTIADTKNSTKKGYLNFSNNNVTLFGDSVPLYLNSTNWISLSTLDDIRLGSSTGDIVQEAGGKIILVPDQSTETTTSSHKLNLEWDSSNSRLVLTPENKLVLSSDHNFALNSPYIYLGQASGTQGQLSGTWKLNSGTLTTSARESKNSIEDVDNRYSVLLDNLKPRRFKYNDGTSDRYHTGLIVDEVKDAMDIAEIDSSEFAAYCLDEEGGGIRYSELITLLIKEVQDLKKQVAELKSPTE